MAVLKMFMWPMTLDGVRMLALGGEEGGDCTIENIFD